MKSKETDWGLVIIIIVIIALPAMLAMFFNNPGLIRIYILYILLLLIWINS